MCSVGTFFAGVLCVLAGCVIGVMIGIRDCKRTFDIPYGAVGVDEDGNYTFS